MKKVSVLIPAFNAAATIRMAVESMLWQEIPEGCRYEVNVLDDGSSDGTKEILEQIAARPGGNKLCVLSNDSNRGVTYSRNRLIAASDADYFVVMDADDISLPGRVVAQVAALEAGHNLVGAYVYNFGEMHGERQYGIDRQHHVILATIDQRSFCHPSIAFDRKVAQIGYRDREAEDYGLLSDVLLAGLDVTNVPRHYLMYRVHGKSLSNSSDGAMFFRLRESVCRIRARYVSSLLGIGVDVAAGYSTAIENRIFRRTTSDDLDSLGRLGALFQDRLGIRVDFKRL